MVLGFSVNYDIQWYLRKYRPEDWKLKSKWVAQIAHGLIAIHKAGITHGDLRCKNVVLGEKLDARIIDIVQGQGFMDGWCPWRYHELESIYQPSWDMYSLGASIWEILTNGECPPENQALQFDFALPDDNIALLLKEIALRCVSDDPKERPTAEQIHRELGGKNLCGCEYEDEQLFVPPPY
jgi:serine/threonine protein kinase